jgi:cytochrome c-type biogenesis protein CcmE
MSSTFTSKKTNRTKLLIGGLLMVAAVAVMIISATRSTAEFYLSVRELKAAEQQYAGENLRVSGAVLGDSIAYHSETGTLHFTIANIPGDDKEIEALGGISAALHQAVTNLDNARLDVIYKGPKPDMLKDEAQAILTGTVNSDGIFLAEELLLKCPSKYEEAPPQ